MARIPEAAIERLKSEICLERLVESAGVVLIRRTVRGQGDQPQLQLLQGLRSGHG